MVGQLWIKGVILGASRCDLCVGERESERERDREREREGEGERRGIATWAAVEPIGLLNVEFTQPSCLSNRNAWIESFDST